jgi:asparagine synthase (glutamine-hydrolysing)
VLPHLYERHGVEFMERLRGKFGLAVWDARRRRLVLARDRLGVKPLYYAQVGDRLVFGSELKSVLASGLVPTDLDYAAIDAYLSFGFVPGPATPLAAVRKLGAGERLVVESGSMRVERYWSYPLPAPEAPVRDEGEYADELLHLLDESVRLRLMSDVPLGAMLSGGLDSSLIVGLLAQSGQRGLATFSVGFDDVGEREGNEFKYSDLVAREFDTDHHKLPVPTEDMLPALGGAIRAMSEPMVSHDAVAFYLLSEAVSQHLKVVQSGQGADEVFAGYSWYPPLFRAEGTGADAYQAAFFDRPHAEMTETLQARYLLPEDPSREFLDRHFGMPGADTAVDRGLRLDTEIMLVDDPVKRVDNMTMAWGLEARTPFLDHELVELAAACPPELKLSQSGKGILKTAARGVVPDAVIDRPKGYFPVPALSTLEGATLELVRVTLDASAIRARGLLRPDHVEQLLAAPNDHLTTLEGSKLWQLALLELWLTEHGI